MEEQEILQILVDNGVLKSTDKKEFFNLQLTRDGYTGTVEKIILAINECLDRVSE